MIRDNSSAEDIFRLKIADIARRASLTTAERLCGMVELGRRTFGLPIGILARVEGSAYIVDVAQMPGAGISPGDVFDLDVTYCVHTLRNGAPTAFSHVSDGELRHHPCFRTFKMESYIGAPVRVGGEVFGTVSFASPLVRERRFDTLDLEHVAQIARAVGGVLDREADVSAA